MTGIAKNTMIQIPLRARDGKELGATELSAEIFGAKINKRLLDQVARLYANNKRTGNAHTKTRAEVRGGGKKPWKQKGTGRARASSTRSPLWRGGGTVFGPRKRDIYNTIPQETRRQALISALSKKVKDAAMIAVDDLTVSSRKTKDFFTILKNLGIDNKNTLWVVAEADMLMKQATRNIQVLSLKRAGDLNAYHVMRRPVMLIDRKTIAVLEQRLLNNYGAAGDEK